MSMQSPNVRFEGSTDLLGRGLKSENDPNETLTAPNGNAPDAGFGLYQSTLFSC
jgi:hypothetical protein